MSKDIKLPKNTMIKWNHTDEDDVALLKWLHNKPKEYIIKEALKLYKKREELMTDAILPQAVPQQQPVQPQYIPTPPPADDGDDLPF